MPKNSNIQSDKPLSSIQKQIIKRIDLSNFDLFEPGSRRCSEHEAINEIEQLILMIVSEMGIEHKNETKSLEDVVNEVTSENNKLQNKILQMENNMKCQVAQARAARRKIKKENEELKKEIEIVNVADPLNRELRKINRELKKKNAELEDVLLVMSGKLGEMKMRLAESSKRKLQMENLELKKKISDIEELLTQARAKGRLHDEVREIGVENKGRMEEEAENLIQELRETIEKMQQEKTTLTNSEQSLKGSIKKMAGENKMKMKEMQEKIGKMGTESIEQLQETIKRMQNDLNTEKSLKGSIKRIGEENKAKMMDAEISILKLKEENNRFNEQIRSIENMNQRLVEENCELKEIILKIDNENRKLKERMSEMKMEHSDQMEYAGGVISHVTRINNELQEKIREMQVDELKYTFADDIRIPKNRSSCCHVSLQI